MSLLQKKPSAFSLIELSIVLAIISILVTGALSLSTNNANKEKIRITNERINEVYKAMGIYLAKNGKLPCPASVKIDKTNQSYGSAADCSYDCSSSFPSSSLGIWCAKNNTNVWYGMIPTKTLKLSSDYAEDAFGNRFSYFVLRGYTNTSTFGTENDATFVGNGAPNNYTATVDNLSIGTNRIRVHETLNFGNPKPITYNAIFVIVSHGPNGYGAWNSYSTTQNSLSTSTSESGNYISGTVDSPSTGKATFYNYPSDYLTAYNDADGIFDDIVFFKTVDQIVSDFNIMHLIHCDKPFGTNTYPANNSARITDSKSDTGYFEWTNSTDSNRPIKYGQIVEANSSGSCASPYTKVLAKATRRCGAFGIWDPGLTYNCLR